MKTVLIVALGGAIGSVARFLVGKAALHIWGPNFPWGTMIVNIAGSFAIGLLAGLFAYMVNWSQDMRNFAIVGVLGGFTTFSSFALDAFTLYERGSYGAAIFYVMGSLFISLISVAAGMAIVRGFTP